MFSGKGIYEAEDTMDLAARLCSDDQARGHCLLLNPVDHYHNQ